MFKTKHGLGSFMVAVACLAGVAESPDTSLAQQGAASSKVRAKRVRAKKSGAK